MATKLPNGVLDSLELSPVNHLKQHQLQAFATIYHRTVEGYNPIDVVVNSWNSLPIAVRNNPKAIMVSLLGIPSWDSYARNGIHFDTIKTRVEMINGFEAIKFSTKPNISLLTMIGKHKEVILNNMVYDSTYFINAMNLPDYDVGGQKWGYCFGLSPEIEKKIHNNWANVVQVARWMKRVSNRRKDARDRYNNSADAASTLPERLARIVNSIAAVRPSNWESNLFGITRTIASRLRPDGECLGIELEFLGKKGSQIVNWQDDEFPVAPWLYYKGDSSITSHASDESTARYQEMTYFLNSKSNKDWKFVEETLETMNKAGARVNRSCGTHVHLDMRHKSNQSASRTAGKIRDAINAWAHRTVSHSRAYNDYCGIHRDSYNNKYTAVNTLTLARHGTVEVRLGMPTLNFNKLKLWCEFLQYLATPYTNVNTFNEFMESNAPAHLKYYAFSRILKFQGTYTSQGVAPLENFQDYKSMFSSLEVGPE